MENFENYIFSAIFFIIVCAIYYFWKIHKKKSSNSQNKSVLENLELARSQFEIFNIKQQEKGTKSGLSAMLREVDKNGLSMEVGDYVSEDWNMKPVDVYFQVLKDGNPISYVFSSSITKLNSDYGVSTFLLKLPQNMRVEKKRHFIRVQPKQSDVHLIGVWPMLPGKALPQTVDEMDKPLTHYKPGMKESQVQLENISGAGIALRIISDKSGQLPMQFSRGMQLLCLVDYSMDENKNTAFWCTGEIMNIRHEEGQKPAVVLGLEFTNWAVLEQGHGEIHWAHSSPSRGAKPILQWVEKIDSKSRQKV